MFDSWFDVKHIITDVAWEGTGCGFDFWFDVKHIITHVHRAYNDSFSCVCSLNPIHQNFIPHPYSITILILSPLFFTTVSMPIHFELCNVRIHQSVEWLLLLLDSLDTYITGYENVVLKIIYFTLNVHPYLKFPKELPDLNWWSHIKWKG